MRPALGKRTTVDLAKRWGSDRSVVDSATAKLQDGLSKAQSGGVGADAMRQLKLAVDYGKARLHKEARLSAQGALRHSVCGEPGSRSRMRHGAEVRQLHRAVGVSRPDISARREGDPLPVSKSEAPPGDPRRGFFFPAWVGQRVMVRALACPQSVDRLILGALVIFITVRAFLSSSWTI
jgi:hypothetical protein